MLPIAICAFTLTTTLGCYLLVRAAADQWLRWLGGGLLLYALIFALLIVQGSPLLWVLIGLSLVMTVADLLLARHKIIEFGEAIWADLLRAGVGALLVALFFAVPVLVVMAVTEVTKPLLALLLSTIALALATQLLASPLQRWLDRLTFANRPQLQETRATLRETAEALPRSDEALSLVALTDAEFTRLTRRALSNLGDLPRLATSPLTRLPAVDARLTSAAQEDNTLTRATILRELLSAAILQLKPTTSTATATTFDSSDSWRHYNALYYPYVVGLKPYSRRAGHDQLDPASRQALDWFAAQVPERTLYNWQNGAAKLVAQHLRELG